MNVAQLNSRIAMVNAETKRLNNERQTNIGRRDTLSKQLNEALARYKETYGVDLTADNLESEIARVSQLKEQEISTVETILALIKEGRYDEAKKLVEGDSVQEPVSVTGAVAEVMQSSVGETESGVVIPVEEPKPAVVIPAEESIPAPPVAPPPVSMPATPPVVDNNGFFGGVATPPTPPVAPPLSGLGIPTPPVKTTPAFPNLGTPVEPKPAKALSGLMDDLGTPPAPPAPPKKNITSFGTILQGGQPFNP